jgi:hypothetical protein
VCRRILTYALAAVVGLAVAGVTTEAYLRITRPDETFGAATELPARRSTGADLSARYTIDPVFGFRPVLGTEAYTVYGTQPNSYAVAKSVGVTRVLFIGDSVTARGGIIRALKQLYGERDLEYWNAGVGGFNTVQEVEYYKRYNAAIKPDHVVLTFVFNDFATTPIAFWDRDDKLVLYAPNRPLTGISPQLFRASYLYRLVLGFLLSEHDWVAITEQIYLSFSDLKQTLADEEVALTVLVLPILEPRARWRELQIHFHTTILRILRELQIEHHDLLPVLEQAFRDGVPVKRAHRDRIHPSDDACFLIAQHLHRNGLFQSSQTAGSG